MLRFTSRVFADHYQFYMYDSTYDHFCDPRLVWNDENRQEHGYLATEKAIYISTVAHLNDHRVKIYIDEEPGDKNSYERRFVRELILDSGKLVISAIANEPQEDIVVDLDPGFYRIYIMGNSIGKDQFSYDPDGEPMEDEDYLSHDEFENYDIYITRSEQDAELKAEE